MILIISVLTFFFILFLALGLNNVIRAEQQEAASRIQYRLRAGERAITAIQLERKERMSDLPVFNRLLKRTKHLRRFQAFLEQSGTSLSVGTYLLFSAFLFSLLFFSAVLMKVNLLIAFAVSAGTLVIPYFFVSTLRFNRFKQFSERLPDSISILSNSLRVGHSLQMAFESVVKEAKDNKDIVAQEFERVLSEVEVGQNFETALKGILTRIDTPELRLFISAVLLQRETGGNLTELLDNLEEIIRERQQLRREMRSATAQARLSGIILTLLPIVVGTAILVLNRQYIMFFFHDPAGPRLLAIAIVMQVIGTILINKVVNIDI